MKHLILFKKWLPEPLSLGNPILVDCFPYTWYMFFFFFDNGWVWLFFLCKSRLPKVGFVQFKFCRSTKFFFFFGNLKKKINCALKILKIQTFLNPQLQLCNVSFHKVFTISVFIFIYCFEVILCVFCNSETFLMPCSPAPVLLIKSFAFNKEFLEFILM